MKLSKILLVLICFFAVSQICFGQAEEDSQPTENWLKEYNIYPEQFLFHRYDLYSKADVVRFREKLDLLKDAKFRSEWEGVYGPGFGDVVGVSSFRLDFNVGFVDFYIYTCLPELRYLNYGKVINLPESIEIIPEFATDSPRKSLLVKYVKVKWNDRNYLVEEPSLPAFAEKVVGIYIEPEDSEGNAYQKWARYWVKGDFEKELTGLPLFPVSYRKLQRQPIETKIVSVGKRTIEKEVETAEWVSNEETAVYKVMLGAGAGKGVKKKMVFSVLETGEQILITEVKQNNSTGIIARRIDENKNDVCYKDEYYIDETACQKIKSSLKVSTQIGKF